MKILLQVNKRSLSRTEFAGLASVPPEVEWFKNIGTAQTARAYKRDVGEFTQLSLASTIPKKCAWSHVLMSLLGVTTVKPVI